MAQAALSDVVVLELASGVAGPYCGKLLADLGAQVVKVEPAAGDRLRGEPPLVGAESAFFNYMNANKLGALLELADPRLDRLIAHADVVVHDARGEAADALDARVAALAPGAVCLSLTPYGRSGERAGWQATPFTEWATAGYHYFGGDPERMPLALPGFQAEFHAGVHAAVAALAGLWHARNTGQGQAVEISHQEAVLNDQAWLTTMWTHMGQVQRRTGSPYVRCADGFVYLFNLAPYPNLFVLMERFDLLEDESLQQPLNWVQRFPEVRAAFEEWCATRTKAEVYHAAQELRIAASPVNTMEDVANSEQLAAREWFGTVEAAGKSFKATGFPYRMTATPCVTTSPAPRIGEHTEAVLSPAFAWANAAAPNPKSKIQNPKSQALAGIRLIEVTANWAGPIAGRHFADLGADVIKIELQTKPATRALIYPVEDLWPDFFHRSGYFNKLNRNKRAIALDLSKPRGREVFLELVGKADAVLENNAARVMAQLGLAYEDLRAVNPGIIMCSMSGYGSSGPERNYSAYGSNIETASGLASLLGYGPGEFFGTGSFYADPVTGNQGAVALLAALHARRRTGQGQWIDMALLEAVGPFFAQQFLHYSTTGTVPEPRGDQWGHGWLLQGTYHTAGKDCWLAVTCRDEADLRAAASIAGADGPAAHDVDAALRGWAPGRDHISAARELQAAGVPAAPVLANWEIVSDNHLNDRGYFVPVRHPSVGTYPFPGFAWRFGATPASIDRPAPRFAEHNEAVFRDILGLSAAEVADLHAAGVTGDAPIYAAGPSL
jgi:crotonobetainyl-CoA:carnitine CoA-transferase CaiB-like acyl-CoA transferase